MIKIENITKSFNDKAILKEVNLLIEEGKITAVYGPNGCGKSTLAKILCGLYKIDSGSIYLDDNLIFSNNTKYNRELGKSIQIVFQEPFNSLDPKQKIRNSLIEIIKLNNKNKSKDEINNILFDVTSTLGLKEEVLNLYPHQISGGEAQRINIAKCLLSGAKYIILDEATSMLDVVTQANIFYYIRKLVYESKMGILLISHDIDLVNLVSDVIYTYKNKNFLKEEAK